MEYLVPYQKAGVFAEMADYWLRHNPEATQTETAVAMQQIQNRVDSRLGQVNYERLFANNIAKNIVQGVIRAPGWTGGTILEVGGGLKDLYGTIRNARSNGKLVFTDRSAYTLSLLMFGAVSNAVLTAIFTGDKPRDWRDLFTFKTGNIDEYGDPERYFLPTYGKDIVAYGTGFGTTISHKLHPALGLIGDVVSNKDYYGVEVRHKGDNPLKQAGQVALYGAKAFIPFWMRGVAKEKERDGSALAMAAPLIGIMPAPKRINQTSAEALASELIKGHLQQRSRTLEEAERGQMKAQLGRAMRLSPGESPPEVRQAMSEGQLSRRELASMFKKSRSQPIVNQIKSLTMDEALQVWDEASPYEKKTIKPVMLIKIRRMAHSGAKSDFESIRPELIKAGLIND